MKRSGVLVIVSGLVLLGLTVPAGAAGSARSRPGARVVRARSIPATQTTRGHFAQSPAGRMLAERGYLPRFPATYDAAKAAAATRVSGASAQIGPAPVTPPSTLRSWAGQTDTGVTPPDTTGAAGESSYIEAINRRFAIYSRTGALITSSGLRSFVGAPDSANTDPQVIWDPATGVFYYVVLNANNDDLYYGWSKTGNPTTLTATSWCQFAYAGYGVAAELPDYPKLGDTIDLGMIGVNVYDDFTGNYVQSDVVTFSKPSPGSTSDCSTPPTTVVLTNLTDGSGNQAFTPVPAVQTDPFMFGDVIAATPNLATPSNSKCGNELTGFGVDAIGGGVDISSATNVAVTEYDLPANAPQKGTSYRLDTLDCRLTQAMTGIDPSNGGSAGAGELWTQHTVSGGAGSKVSWYEIHGDGTVDESGSISGPSTYAFNGAISSNRSVPQVGPAQFGDSMVMGFNTSSTTQYPAIRMVSKIAAASRSKWVTLKNSPGFNRDFGCGLGGVPKLCRWGDYSSASADPRTSPTGHVFLANQWNVASVTNADVDARTFVWEAVP